MVAEDDVSVVKEEEGGGGGGDLGPSRDKYN